MLMVTELELQSILVTYRRSMDALSDHTPDEAFVNLEWLALILQGHEYDRAYQLAREKVYGLATSPTAAPAADTPAIGPESPPTAKPSIYLE